MRSSFNVALIFVVDASLRPYGHYDCNKIMIQNVSNELSSVDELVIGVGNASETETYINLISAL